MRLRILAFLAAFFASLLLIPFTCQANANNDLATILAAAKPGQAYADLSFLTVKKVMGKAKLYQGQTGDINVYVWVDNGVVDSLFLTVKGKLYPDWATTVVISLGKPDTDCSGEQGRLLRYSTNNFEYYLVLLNKNGNRDFLPDLTVFVRGSGHERNELYHEDGDIWLSTLKSNNN
jgi:hypothetical protein